MFTIIVLLIVHIVAKINLVHYTHFCLFVALFAILSLSLSLYAARLRIMRPLTTFPITLCVHAQQPNG